MHRTILVLAALIPALAFASGSNLTITVGGPSSSYGVLEVNNVAITLVLGAANVQLGLVNEPWAAPEWLMPVAFDARLRSLEITGTGLDLSMIRLMSYTIIHDETETWSGSESRD